MQQLRLLSRNKRRTQRIVMEFESQGGNQLEFAHVDTGKGGTPNAGTSSSQPYDPRRGDIVVPTSTPSAAPATAAV